MWERSVILALQIVLEKHRLTKYRSRGWQRPARRDRNACRVKLPGGVQSAQEDRARTPANQRQPLRPENRADFRGFRICPEVVTGPGRSSMIALDLYGKGSSS